MERVVITGASGLLGRAVFAAFEHDSGCQLQGWASSRLHGGKFHRVDLCSDQDVHNALNTFQPTLIIHCAAIRRPDEIDKNEATSRKLNVSATELLAQYTATHSPTTTMVLISTDYVFDGRDPPYLEDARPNPLNEYGRQKLQAEQAVQRLLKAPQYAILRVPMLHGPVEYLGEGAVDALLKTVITATATNAALFVDDAQTRFPTHVADVATVLKMLITKRTKLADFGGIYHWSATSRTTKWGMAMTMAAAFGFPTVNLLKATPTETATSATVSRPENAQLARVRIETDFKSELTSERPFLEFADAIKECYCDLVKQSLQK